MVQRFHQAIVFWKINHTQKVGQLYRSSDVGFSEIYSLKDFVVTTFTFWGQRELQPSIQTVLANPAGLEPASSSMGS